MKTDNEIYTPDELEAIRHIENIENGEYTALPQDEFEKEKNRFQTMAINTINGFPIGNKPPNKN